MKAIFWLLLLIFVGLLGWLSYDFIVNRRAQADVVRFDSHPDSIAAYQQRLAELEARAESLRQRFNATNILRRPAVNARLMQLEEDIAALRRAIEAWEAASRSTDLYRQCILMYGKASGVCDALALDTLPISE